MNRLNELRYGTSTDVMYHLDHTACSNNELAAALVNAFTRIEQLEKEIVALKKPRSSK